MNDIKSNLIKILTLAKQMLLLMVIYMLQRVLFFAFNTEYYPEMTFNRFMLIVQGGLRFDLSAIMFINALYIVLFMLPFSFTNSKSFKKILSFIFLVTNAIAIAVNTGDIFYYDFTLKRSTADVFMLMGESNIGTLFISFIKNYWYGFLILFSCIYLMYILYRRLFLKQFKVYNKYIFTSVGIICLLLVSALAIVGMRSSFVNKTFPITLGDAGQYTTKVQDMALVLNTPFTLIKTIETQALEEKNYFDEKEVNEILNPIHTPDKNNKFKARNVVIIVLESFSREVISALNPNLKSTDTYTPFLDSLIHKSLSFPNAFANGRQSISALPAITSSIPYAKQSFVASPYASNKLCSLGKMLTKKGYHTSFFHGAQNGSLGLGAFMNYVDYSYYYGMNEYGKRADYDGSWGIFDDKFFNFFADEINKFKQPFHTVLFSLSSHNPYVIPDEFADKFKNVESDRKKTYLYADYSLQKLFHKISKYEWFDSTLFVITADHSVRSENKLYNTNVNSYAIPIIFYCPSDSGLTGFNNKVIQHLDVMPSILDYLQYDEPYFSFGTSCFDTITQSGAFINHLNTWQYISGEYILIYHSDNQFALYNYKNDVFLKNNLSENKTDITKKMKKHIKAFIQQHNNRMLSNSLTINN